MATTSLNQLLFLILAACILFSNYAHAGQFIATIEQVDLLQNKITLIPNRTLRLSPEVSVHTKQGQVGRELLQYGQMLQLETKKGPNGESIVVSIIILEPVKQPLAF